jgi:hypothetical protein
MSLTKKIVAIATVFSVLTFVSPVFAVTVEELQAQINALLAQLSTLQAQLAALQGTTGGVTGCTITSFARNLSQGMSGDDVKCLQIILNSATDTQVATEGAGSPGNETTYFGPLTKAAVIKFQEKYASEVLTPLGLTAGTGYVGAKTRAKLDTFLGVTPPPTGCTTDADCAAGYMCSAGTCVVRPVGAPMSVALATDTPPAANLWRGSANNVVTKLTFYGGSTPVSITGLTLTSYGTTEATGNTDLTAIKIFDESNIQQGSDKTIAGNKIYFVFVPAITVPANGNRTLSVAVNVGSNATVMAVVKLGIASAADITGATFTGTFPVVGNSFTIVPAGSIGSLSVGDYSAVPKTSVKIGEKDVVLERFTVSAGANEDVEINQITVTNAAAATISDSDITNIRIKEVGGAVVAGPANLLAKKATINFTTPYPLTKGMAKNFDVIADIVSGNGRNIQISLATGAVVGKGKLSGINLTSGGSTTATTISIGVGTLSVSMSDKHPQGAASYFVKTATRRILAAWDVRATGEDIIINQIKVGINSDDGLGATDYVGSAGLYDGDALISNLQDINAEFVSGTTEFTFTTNWTIPANTTKTLYLKGMTDNISCEGGSSGLTSTFSEYTAYGLSSGLQIGTSGSAYQTDVGTTAVTVYASPTATLAADSTKTPYSQGILAPVNNVTLGAWKVYAQRENLRLTDLVVEVSGTNYNDESEISTITLYADDGVTPLSNPVSYNTADTDNTYDYFIFSSSDFLSDIVFPENTYKTILVKANVATQDASHATDVVATIKHTVTIGSTTYKTSFIGQESGQTYDASAATSLYFTTPYAGGTYSLDPTIVEITKCADSPSGSVSRGSAEVYACWDVKNLSSDLAAVKISKIKLTSKSGLSSNLDDAADETLFNLSDENGNVIFAGNATKDALTEAAGTIYFNGGSFDNTRYLTVNTGEPKKLILTINTTDTNKWPSKQQMQWSVEAVGDITVETDATPDGTAEGYAGYGGTTWSIPARTNIVTLP